MLHLYRSHRIEHLLELLQHALKVLAQQELGLAPIWVVVPHEMVADWLRFRLADTLGICAGVRFALPAQLGWIVLQETYQDVPDITPADPKVLAFYFDAWLGNASVIAQFPWLKQYVEKIGLKGRWQLASQVARNFDQYILYRPDWISAWSAGKRLGLGSDEAWQAVLWRDFVRDCGARRQRQYGLRDQSAILLDLENWGEHWVGWMLAWRQRKQEIAVNFETSIQAPTPGAVFFFGGCEFSPMYWQFLQHFSAQQQIAYFCWDPCREYWGLEQGEGEQLLFAEESEGKVQNTELRPIQESRHVESVCLELLCAQGRTGRFFLDQLQDLAGDVTAIYPEDDVIGSEHRLPVTLLQALQEQIRNLSIQPLVPQGGVASAQDSEERISFTDQSFSVHCTSSLMREVEVLHEEITQHLDRHPDWTAADVLVLLPDYPTYIPYIDAVFGTSSTPVIPYSLADSPSVLGAVWLDWLRLPDSRWSVEILLDWFELPAVAARFGLVITQQGATGETDFPDNYADQIAYLRRLVKASNMRWGRNAAHKKEMGLPGEERYTIAWGLSRLWLGYALSAEDLAEPYFDMLPAAEIADTYLEVVLAWDRYLQALQDFSDQLKKVYSIADWVDCLRRGLQSLICPVHHADREIVKTLNQRIEDWQHFAALATELSTKSDISEIRFDRQSVLAWFEEAHWTLARPARWRGGVLFAPFMAAAGLPFKMIAVLGLQSDEFPKVEFADSFDLLAQHPRRGDRSTQGEARWLFFQTCCAAKQVLYLSYQGRDPVDGTTRPPAGVVAEWMEMIERLYGKAQLQHCVIEHALQPFQTSNVTLENPSEIVETNADQSGWLNLSNYQEVREHYIATFSNKLSSDAPLNGQNPLFDFPEEVSLEDVLLFFRNPTRWFARRVLRLHLPELLEQISQDEPLVGNPRLARQLQQQALVAPESINQEELSENILAYGHAAGWVPAGEQGEIWGQQVLRVATALRGKVHPARQCLSLPIQIEFFGVQFAGSLHNIGDQGLQYWLAGKLGNADYLTLWIQHLLWMHGRQHAAWAGEVEEIPAISKLLGLEQEIWFPVLASVEPYLERLIYWYCQGQKLPLPCFKDASRDWAFACLRNPLLRQDALSVELSRFGRKWLKSWADRSVATNWSGLGRDPYEAWIWREVNPFVDPLAVLFDALAGDIWLPLLQFVQVREC